MASVAVLRANVPHVPWWTVLLEGIAAIIVGLLFLAAPGATTLVLVQIAGWYWLIMGIFSIVNIFVDSRRWGWKLLVGALGIIAGLAVIQDPLWSALIIPALIVTYLAVWALIIGVVRLIQAFAGAGWGTGILAVINILFGLALLAFPMLGAATFLYVFAIVAIVGGLMAIIASFRYRGMEHEVMTRPLPPVTIPVTGEQNEIPRQHDTPRESTPRENTPRENTPRESAEDVNKPE